MESLRIIDSAQNIWINLNSFLDWIESENGIKVQRPSN